MERREVVEFSCGREGATRTGAVDCGLARTCDGGGHRRDLWQTLSPDQALPALPTLPDTLRRNVEQLLAEELLPTLEPEPWLAGLGWLERAHPGARAEIRVRESHQRVLCHGEGGLIADDRHRAQVALWALVEREGKTASLLREYAFADRQALLAALPRLLDGLPGLWALANQRLEATPVEGGPLTVVLAHGADAGVFLHEVCGHPLEGDVVARGELGAALRLGGGTGLARGRRR